MVEPPSDKRKARPPRPPIDGRVLGIVAIALVVCIALVLAHVMSSLNHADQCLAMAGRNC